jgi:hypothetical protein
MCPVCCLNCASGLDAAKDLQELRRCDLLDGADAQPREDVPLETPDDLAGMPWRPARGVLRVPFPRDGLQAVFATPRDLRGFPGRAWIDAGCQLLAGLVAAGAGVLQSNSRIHAERDPLVLTLEAVLEPPQAGFVRLHE